MNTKRYLILSADGIRAQDEGATAAVTRTLKAMMTTASARALGTKLGARVAASADTKARKKTAVRRKFKAAAAPSLEVINSTAKDGVKLVRATEATMAALRQQHPGLRIVEETFCLPALAPQAAVLRAPAARAVAAKAKKTATAAAASSHLVRVVRAGSGAPVRGARVVAFTDYANRVGFEAKTIANGEATLPFTGKAPVIERLFVFHEEPGLWSHHAKKVTLKAQPLVIELPALDLAQEDGLRHFHGAGADDAGTGVRVGVIDSGVDATHPDLRVTGGKNCLPQPDEPADHGPDGDPHGTHVAGIIAGRGTAPGGMRGLAPAAEIRSYRVFGKKREGSGSSFAVISALDQAVIDQCDIVNLSLSFPPGVNDPAVAAALRRARDHGCLPVAAAGNDGRQPVSFPASSTHALAVSAAGRKKTFPQSSSETADISTPSGTDKANFLAAFSNNGLELDCTGAGVGVVSTVPGGHAAMSGTSMASPAVAGTIARLLAARPDILAMPRDATRTEAIAGLAMSAAKSLGFGNLFEGNGLPK